MRTRARRSREPRRARVLAQTGPGRKSLYPVKSRETAIALTPVALDVLDAARRERCSRNDMIETLLREHARDYRASFSVPTLTTTKDGRKLPRSIRLTEYGFQLLDDTRSRTRQSASQLIETLIRLHAPSIAVPVLPRMETTR